MPQLIDFIDLGKCILIHISAISIKVNMLYLAQLLEYIHSTKASTIKTIKQNMMRQIMANKMINSQVTRRAIHKSQNSH